MYLNDFKIKHLLAIFFAVGIAHELVDLLGFSIPELSLVYSVGLLIVIFNFSSIKRYIWPPGLGIVGIFSLLYFLFLLIGYGAGFFRNLSSVISISVWLKCISCLDKEIDMNDYE